MDFHQFTNVFNIPPERNNYVSDEAAEVFENKGKLTWNSRSFISDFVKFILDPTHSPLNRKFYWNAEKDIYDNMLDGYDLDNDEDWIEAVTYIFDFYCTKILCEKESYFMVLNGTEDLSHKRRIVNGCFNLLCYSSSSDLKERYYSVDELFKNGKVIRELERNII